MTARRMFLTACLAAGVLVPLSASGQELVVRSAAAATQPVEEPLPTMDYSHPELPADGSWAGLMVGLLLVSFFLAALIGVITDIDKSFAPSDRRSAASGPHAPHH